MVDTAWWILPAATSVKEADSIVDISYLNIDAI